MSDDAIIKGTFTTTGTTDPIGGRKVGIILDFAGTASVDVEMQMPSGAWVKVPDTGTGITADGPLLLEWPTDVQVRLNCTAHTNNVEYAMMTSRKD